MPKLEGGSVMTPPSEKQEMPEHIHACRYTLAPNEGYFSTSMMIHSTEYIRADLASRVTGASEKVDFDLDAEIRKAWRNHCHGTGDFDVMDNQIFRMTKNEFRAGVMEIFLTVRAAERREGK